MAASTWPVVGRDRELEPILQSVCADQPPRGVVIVGDAGVGKTRLAQEVCSRLHPADVLTTWVTGTASSRGIPLGAFSPIVRDVAGNPFQLLRRASVDVERTGQNRRLLLVVDDAHHLDDLSASLVHQLVQEGRITVLLTLRAGERASDAVDSLWSHGILPRVDLETLPDEDIAELLGLVLDGPIQAETLGRLCQLAQGNALFLRLVVEGELSAARLAKTDGSWVWQGRFAPSVQLRDLVRTRIDTLGSQAQRAMETVAVAGPISLATLLRVCTPGGVEEAERRGLVRVAETPEGTQVQAGHPLYGEVVRDGLGVMAARRLNGQVASALVQEPQTPGTVLRRAALTLDSDLPADPELFLAGSQCSLQRLDWDLARRLGRAASRSNRAAEGLLAVGYALSFGGRMQEAEGVLAAAADLASSPELALRVSMPRAAHLYWMLGHVPEARSMLQEAMDAQPDPRSGRALTGMLSMVEACSGNVSVGRRLAAGVLDEATLPAMAHLSAMWALVAAAAVSGGVGDQIESAMAVYEAAGSEFELAQPRLGLAHYLVWGLTNAGHLRQAEEVARRAVEDVDPGAGPARLMAELVQVRVDLARGLPATCLRSGHTSIDGLNGLETGGWMTQGLLEVTTAAALLGRSDEASAAWARLSNARHPAHGLLETDIRLAGAWVDACRGALTPARRRGWDAADWARSEGLPLLELKALQALVRFGDPRAGPRLESVAEGLECPRGAAAAMHARALGAGDATALLGAADAYEDFGDRLAAADAAAQASGALSRQGRRGSALVAAGRARRLQQTCEGGRTPALEEALDPVPLTSREREVTRLASSGLSNRQIADELVVSVRTVEGHLYRSMGKLGVSRRAELTALFFPASTAAPSARGD